MPRLRWRDRRGTFREHSPLGARVAELSASTLRLARPSRHLPRAPPTWREGCGTFREHLSAWREGCGTFRKHLSRATGPCGISRDRHSRFRHQSFKVVPASADAVPLRVPARHLGLRGSAAPRQAVSPSLFRSTGGGRESLWLDFGFIFALVGDSFCFHADFRRKDYFIFSKKSTASSFSLNWH